MSADEYQKETDRLAAEGYRPVALSTYSVNGGP
jgi:hypothetical protein